MILKFYVAPASFLNLPAPEDDTRYGYRMATPPQFDEQGNKVAEAVMERKKMSDFLLHWRTSNDGSQICFMLACKHNDHCRYTPNTDEDVDQWKDWMDRNQFNRLEVFDVEQFDALMETAEWKVIP